MVSVIRSYEVIIGMKTAGKMFRIKVKFNQNSFHTVIIDMKVRAVLGFQWFL